MLCSIHCSWQDKPEMSEVTTSTVFIMVFAVIVVKDFMAMSNDSLSQMDNQTVLFVYTNYQTKKQNESKQIPNLSSKSSWMQNADLPPSPLREWKETYVHSLPKETQVCNQFNDKSSTLKIMAAKETTTAELGIIFKMLKMMNEQALCANLDAYQNIIDACSCWGNTNWVMKLLSRMH